MRAERERPDLGRGIHRIADLELRRARDECVDECRCDRALDEDARAGEALLPVVGEDPEQRAVERALEVRRREYDVGGLPAELERARLETVTGGGHHRTAGGRAPR